MNTHADRLFRAVFFTALLGLPIGCATQHLPDDQRQAAEPATAVEPLAIGDLAHDGRVLFSRQPREADLRAFAAYGGSAVINARTQAEVDKLGYDERAMVESLGMNYVHIPMSGSQLSYELAAKLTAALQANEGTVLLHCASGSRVNGLYVVHQSEQTMASRQTLVAQAVERGMGRGMIQYIERTLMQTPTRVMDAVEPDRMENDIRALVSFGTRHTLSDTGSDVRGIGAARRWVHAQFTDAISMTEKYGDEKPTVSYDVHQLQADGRRILEPAEIVNVICTIPGSMPEARARKYYVLAHLDSRATDIMDASIDAPGANDDGSGVAALIELAHVLAAEHLDATIVLLATSGEEQGLYGAKLHAQANAEGIVAVLNNDMIGDPTGPNGRKDHGHVRVFSQGIPSELLSADPDSLPGQLRTMRMYGGESDNTSRQLARYIYDVAWLHRTAVQPMLVMRPDRFLRGGDHTPFNALGLAAIRFTEVHESYDRQHQDIRTEDGVDYGDVASHVDAEYLANVTRLN
ncbi:MAG: M20/M25/M40 family metallo-hydrolase, partial [Phycisphaerales bacterium]|nr:M20/M25/M40 family metallo-hydrolase [Phycisphaerales bacterium]